MDGRGRDCAVIVCIPIEGYLNYLDFVSCLCLLLSVVKHECPASKICFFFNLAEVLPNTYNMIFCDPTF